MARVSPNLLELALVVLVVAIIATIGLPRRTSRPATATTPPAVQVAQR